MWQRGMWMLVLLAVLGADGSDECRGANNASGTTLCGCGKFVPLAVPTLNIGCVGPAGSQGGLIQKVLFASFGNPVVDGGCGTFRAGTCAGDPGKARAAVEQACVGKASCDIVLDAGHMNGGVDPCPADKDKYVAVEVSCSNVQPPAPAPAPPPAPIPPLPTGAFSPCVDPSSSFSRQPWCNSSIPVAERIADMISRMSRAEKLASLAIRTPSIASLGLPAYNWWEEATHGVGNTHQTTNVAFPITTAMSFNRSLWKATGALIATEARALMNLGQAGSDFWAPVVNLARDGRWGRNIETPGEDPYLSGEYATSFVKGFQESNTDPGHMLANVANSVEHSSEDGMTWDRFEIDSKVTQQDLVDSYMPAFQSCVEKGRVSGLMCSLNAINGKPACADEWLLNQVARQDWGFDGYVTTDCDGYPQAYQYHNYSGSPEEGVRDMLRAGLDVDCAFGAGITLDAQTLSNALRMGLIGEADVDTALGHLLKIPETVICSAEHAATARAGAAQSATLLKNEVRTLPLKMNITAAVIGPNADLSSAIAGYYGAGHPCGGRFPTIVDGVAQYAPNPTFLKGVPGVASNDTSAVANATAAAKAHDATVLVLGTDLTTAHEGHDATDLTLSSAQLELATSVAAAASPKPVIVVVMSAVPLDLTPILANKQIGAVLWVGQPSVQTLGIGDVLFGVVAPAGRLVQTLYPESVQHELSIFDMNMRPGPSPFPRPDGAGCEPGTKRVPCSAGTNTGMCTPDINCKNGTNRGRTHRFFSGQPAAKFGFGLSYTEWHYSLVGPPPDIPFSLAPVHQLLESTSAAKRTFPSLQASQTLQSAPVQYALNVTNTGLVDSDHVVLGFIVPPGAGENGIPLQSLFGFDRIFVEAGKSVMVYLYPELTHFTQVQLDGARVATPGTYRVKFGLEETGERMGYAEHVFAMA